MVYLNSGTAPVTKNSVLKKQYKKQNSNPPKKTKKPNSEQFLLNTDTNM